MGSGLPQTGVELVANNLSGFLGDLQKGNQAVQGFGKQMDTAASQSKSTSEVITGMLRRVGEIAVDSMMKAGQAIIGFGQDSIKLAGDFQSGMQQFQVAAGQDLDAKGLEQFHDLFLQLGKDLPVSTSEVQQAATEMVKGGLDPAILAAGALKQNIQFAAAAMGGDLVGAAEISAKIVAGWAANGATAADKAALLTHATDLLTKAANASSVDVHELSLGLFNVQATAKNAGMDLDGVTTVLAELAGDFASSSEAGNSMASFISRLHPTTKAATEAMEALGLVTKDGANAFYDAQGNFVGWSKASQVLQDAFKGLNAEQRQQMMQTIFQKDAMGVAAGLASRGAEGYDAMTASLTNAMGVQQAGTTIQQGYNTAVENASGGLEALKITLGEKLLPFLTTFYSFVNDKVLTVLIDLAGALFGDQAAFDKLSPALQGVVTAVDVVVADFQGIIGAFQDAGALSSEFGESIGLLAQDLGLPAQPIEDIVFGIQDLAKNWDQITAAFQESLPIIEAIGVSLGTLFVITEVAGWITGVVAAVTAFGAAFTAAGGGIAGVVALLGGPVTIAVGAVALAVGALYLAWTNNWGDIQGKTAAVWAVLQPIFDEVVQWLQVAVPAAVMAAADFWSGTLWPALQQVGSFIETNIFPILDQLANVFLAVAGVEVKALADLWTNILWPALKVVGAFIGDVLWPIFQKLFEVEFAIAQKVGEALAGLWQKVLWPALQSVGTYINDTIIPVIKQMGSYFSDTLSPILDKFNSWLTKITGGFNGVNDAVKWVTDGLSKFADGISNLKLPSWLTPGSPTPWEIALRGIGNALTTTVAPGLKLMTEGTAEVGNQIKSAFIDTDLVNTIEGFGGDLMDGLAAGIKAGMRGVVHVIDQAGNTIEDAFKGGLQINSPSLRMMPIGASVMEGIAEGMASQAAYLKDQVGSIGDGLAEAMQSVMDNLNSIIADGFGATASIDRQMVKNLDKLKDVLPQYQQYVQGALNEASLKAQEFEDPTQGAKYYKMKSDQILEYAKLQKDLSQAESDEDKKRIEQQMLLVNASQAAELKQFDATTQAQSPMRDIAEQINAILKSIADIPLTEDQIHIVDMLSGLWASAATPVTFQRPVYDPGMAQPPMGSSQYPANGGTTNNTQTANYNMPVYTSQSPQVLQQSFALMNALSSV